MAKIEVEHRGRLTPEEFSRIRKYFQKNAKFLGEKRRFSIIYTTSVLSTREAKNDKIDLKLRITNSQPEIALKYGKWSGKDARKEFIFDIDPEQYDDFVEFLKILGYHRAIMIANTKHDFLFHGIEFSLVEVPDWGHYFEAEILSEEDKVKNSIQMIEKELKALKLKACDNKDYYKLLDELNNRSGARVDLNDLSTSKIKKKFKKYFIANYNTDSTN